METQRTIRDFGAMAREASLDAHDKLVPAEVAFAFIREAFIDTLTPEEELDLYHSPTPPNEFCDAYYGVIEVCE